jgi:hypothetical protein
MRLENKQQEQVKVTISKYPFVKGEKGQSKSFTLYECSVDEVHEFFIEAIESSSEEEDEE